jgi:uncharacterized lipoprotein YddW (UPF0748 family)
MKDIWAHIRSLNVNTVFFTYILAAI